MIRAACRLYTTESPLMSNPLQSTGSDGGGSSAESSRVRAV